jgi:hypothetical protein
MPAQAPGLDGPEAQQGRRRDLGLGVGRAQSSPGGQDGGDVTEVAYRLEPHEGGTRFTYEHTGFTGVGGFVMARLLGHVRRGMLDRGLPAVLADPGVAPLRDDGTGRIVR